MHTYNHETRSKLFRAIRQHWKSGVNTDKALVKILTEEGFTAPSGNPLTERSIRPQRLRAGIKMYGKKKRNVGKKGLYISRPEPVRTAKVQVPASVSLILDDSELTDSKKVKMLRAYFS